MLATANNSHIVAGEKKTGVNSWKATLKHGTQSGVSVSVSGAGAYAELQGVMKFKTKRLETSKTYQQMQSDYNISAGVGGFWSWLGIHSNASTHRSEIHSVFNELQTSETVEGVAHIDLSATGQYPNVRVTASAYVAIMEVTDSSGNSFYMASSSAPESDTGAQDSDGNRLTTKDNSSTIEL